MIRLYIKGDLNNKVEFSLKQKHYLLNVMRKPEDIVVFNENFGEFLISIDYKNFDIKTSKFLKKHNQLQDLKLGISILKPKAMHFVIEKATELGASEIFLIKTDHIAVNIKGLETLHEKLIDTSIEASEQSERTCIPKIHAPISLKEFLKKDLKGFIAAIEREQSNNINLETTNGCLIGPEGGFSSIEKKMIKEHIQTISFGELVLRAETAAIFALSTLKLSKTFK